MAGKVDVYRIPPNFAEEGTVLSGRLKMRNAVETVVLEGLLLYVLLLVDAGIKTKLYAGMILLIPCGVLSLLGIQGQSLSLGIYHCLNFIKRRRVLSVPAERERLEHNRKMKSRARYSRKAEGGGKNRKRSGSIETAAARGKKERAAKRTGKEEKRTGKKPAGKEGGSGCGQAAD
ncbi:MAG: hypothetical protein LUI87_13680 [Lachnospiraceae bacterium]|nr:hypothetical protein [Lachnospiraceae bacterium]